MAVWLLAVCSLVLWIVAQMAVVMLAGGKAMNGMFGWHETTTIVGLAVLAGILLAQRARQVPHAEPIPPP